jgi:hypothetical protein
VSYDNYTAATRVALRRPTQYDHVQHMHMEPDMASATSRVVILMTPSEKRSLETKARRLGASAAELVRRSVRSYDPAANDAQIETMLGRLTASHRATMAALDEAEHELAQTRAHLAKKRASRRS